MIYGYLKTKFPTINDITTSPKAPLEFQALKSENPGRDMGYPPEFREIQWQSYPDVKPLDLSQPPEEVFQKVLALVRRQERWQIFQESNDQRRVELVASTQLMKFKDDVVIEVQPSTDGGSRVEMRSKSRKGLSDLGANAKRIQSFLKELRQSMGG